MYLYQAPGLGYFGDTQPKIDRIDFVELNKFRIVEAGLDPIIGYESTSPMSPEKRAKFIEKFMNPMFKQKLGVRLLEAVNNHQNKLSIAWGRFRGTGTFPKNRDAARNGKGSEPLIFIDENGADLDKFPLMRRFPDLILFHELLHACDMQRGKDTAATRQREYRIIGLGDHRDDPFTENAYRGARNLDRRCCLDREAQS